MLWKLFIMLATCCVINAHLHQADHPNVIIINIGNLHWSDLGIHVNQKDSENSTPNIDYLAYSGIILNRFYANGGLHSLLSGCYQKSQYANENLMTFYFEQNGYKVDFIARNSHDKIETFEKEILGGISSENEPFLTVVDFGSLGDDIKIPFVDEIVGSMVTKAHKVDVMNNTIMLFLSLPDNNESPLEIDIRRTAFVYSRSLKLRQRVSSQIIHVIDLLPTLVNASNLKWRTKDRIYVDGINQWHALNTNDEEQRLDVYGGNFYISNYWKLTFGAEDGSDELYGSIENEDMESDKDMTSFDFDYYVNSIFTSELHSILDNISPQKIMFSRSRAKVHCNLKDVDETAVRNIKCSPSNPCLFNLLEDPCEFDNKREAEFESRRNHMKEILERYSRGESIDDISVKSTSDNAESSMQDGEMVGIILGALVLTGILIFIVVVCVKEKCNRRRSVYHAKVKKEKKNPNGNSLENATEDDENAISVISSHVK